MKGSVESIKKVRWRAMAEAARIVCDACGSRAFPCYPEYRNLHDGPPGSGNIIHVAHGIVSLCPATSVWHAIAFERGFGGGSGVRALEGL